MTAAVIKNVVMITAATSRLRLRAIDRCESNRTTTMQAAPPWAPLLTTTESEIFPVHERLRAQAAYEPELAT